MKTHTNILTHTPIDTAPIAASIARLCVSVIAMLDGGLHGAVLEAASKTRRAVQAFCKAELANHQRRLKLEMLSHKHWRRLVLKELGGARALVRWRAAMNRCELRREALEGAPRRELEPSVWRKTPERMAEELRRKAHARKCAKATVHPRITRDPCRMDFEGQFRLPPLPRLCGPRDPDAAWTTPFDIMEYDYNAVPVTRLSGYNAPVMVWPAEFEAAEAWEYEQWLRERAKVNQRGDSAYRSPLRPACAGHLPPSVFQENAGRGEESAVLPFPLSRGKSPRSGGWGERHVPIPDVHHQDTSDERAI